MLSSPGRRVKGRCVSRRLLSSWLRDWDLEGKEGRRWGLGDGDFVLGMGTRNSSCESCLDVRFSLATVELFSASRYVWGLVRDHTLVAGTVMGSKHIMRSADQNFPEHWASACHLGGPGHISQEMVTAHVLPTLGADDRDTS